MAYTPTDSSVLVYLSAASQHLPNWRKPLSDYGGNWVSRVGAHEIKRDSYGPTVVWWMGHYYLRRCGSNPKYGAAIWFSRRVGSGEDGESGYVRLITFSEESPPAGVEPLPDYVVKALGY